MKTNVFLKAFSIFSFCCVLVIAPGSSEAQIWKNMGKKIEKKVEDQASRRLERKIDKAIDKSFDTVENAADEAVKGDNSSKKEKAPKKSDQPVESSSGTTTAPTASSQPSVEAILGAMKQQNATPLTGTYEFKVGVTYEIEVKPQKNKDKVPGFTLWVSESPYLGMATDANTSMFMVMDGEKMITFMEQNKSYMVMGAGMFQGMTAAAIEEAEKDSSPSDYSVTKIGTESILGHTCDVYKVTGEDIEAKMWITNNLGVSAGGFMNSFSAMMKNNKTQIPAVNNAQGVMLKMESKNTSNKEEMKMVATNILKDGKRIDASQYKSMGF